MHGSKRRVLERETTHTKYILTTVNMRISQAKRIKIIKNGQILFQNSKIKLRSLKSEN